MIHINKGSAPLELGQAVREMKRTPDCVPSYDNLRGDTREAIKRSLIAEQHGLCAYCMRKIAPEGGSSIEHIIPQHGEDGRHNLEESLDYGNMVAVCRRQGSPLTCDMSRGNKTMKVNPLVERTLSGIRYTREGEIHSSDPEIDHDLNDTLNLNSRDGYMCQGRKQVWRQLSGKINVIAGGRDSEASRQSLLNRCVQMRRDLLDSEHYPEYIGVLLYRLDHYIRKYS